MIDHVTIRVPSLEAGRRFYDGPPRPRPAYGPDYYGTFVLDAAGNSVDPDR